MTEIERIDQLREELHTHNHNYYILNAPTISDQEFDRLMRELQDLEAKHPEHYDENSPSVRVGSDLNKEFRQVEHRYPMLSLGNTYSETEVREFYERVRKALNEDFEICCELKFDGTSISLTYEDGRLVQAVTRGDGVRGDDVTDNVKTIRSIPLRLSGEGYPRRFEIRGEILMPWTVFEELNREREQREEPLFANPRNAASGTLKSQNSAVVASRKLDATYIICWARNCRTTGIMRICRKRHAGVSRCRRTCARPVRWKRYSTLSTTGTWSAKTCRWLPTALC